VVASDSNYARWRREAEEDFEGFWARAAEELPWFRKWDRVFEPDYPSYRWFTGAQTNLAYNCLDHHIQGGAGDRVALIYANELGGRQSFTYAELAVEVERVAAALRGMGLNKGDRLTIYMPNCPEAAILMLATVRIGAIHSIVFAGFGSQALADRINASGSRLVFTADVAYRKGATVALKPLVDGAMELGCDTVERVVVLKREEAEPQLVTGRDVLWSEFLERGAGQSGHYVEMEANEPAYILATSGTTATPKLVVHTQGGYQVGIYSMGKWCYGLKPTDVWWATSDLGWVVGHSYIVYGPLLFGAASVLYEGALDHPGPDVLWRLVEEFKVTGIFTSPTAVRLLMRSGDETAKGIDLSSLERIVCAGEVLNPPVLEWLEQRILGGRVPVIDNWWQTETGAPVIGNPYGLGMVRVKAGSAGVPLPGTEVAIMNMEGEECAPGEKGILVIKRSFPNLTATIWGDPERYGRDYWGKIDGVYFTGDLASIDEDGYVWFSGRADEVIKIAAHRIGSIEVETAFLRHEAVAEAGVTGRPDPLRGEVISGFIVLKNGYSPSDQLKSELHQVVRKELGPVAVIGDVNFVRMLPKTRSGKTMRRVLKAITSGADPGDITTIEDEGSVEEARQAWEELKGDVASQP
jgi:acetyl-CoA synthetase